MTVRQVGCPSLAWLCVGEAERYSFSCLIWTEAVP